MGTAIKPTGTTPRMAMDRLTCPICHEKTVVASYILGTNGEEYAMVMHCECPRIASPDDLKFARSSIRNHMINGDTLFLLQRFDKKDLLPDFSPVTDDQYVTYVMGADKGVKNDS